LFTKQKVGALWKLMTQWVVTEVNQTGCIFPPPKHKNGSQPWQPEKDGKTDIEDQEPVPADFVEYSCKSIWVIV
jgi:hypothetical protein